MTPTPNKEINNLLIKVLSHPSLDTIVGMLPRPHDTRSDRNVRSLDDLERQISYFFLFKEEINVI
jgi:hypothetical protein